MIGCAFPEYPGVYSRVAEEVSFMENMICSRENGMSPMSCIIGDDGQYHLKDYATEAMVKQRTANLSNRNPGSRGASNDDGFTRISRKRVHITLYFSADTVQQSPVNKKACELLKGSAVSDPPTSKPTSLSASNTGASVKLDLGMNTSCPRQNKSDVNYFVAEDSKIRNCFWVKSSCRTLCADYSSCCPETCSQDRCQRWSYESQSFWNN